MYSYPYSDNNHSDNTPVPRRTIKFEPTPQYEAHINLSPHAQSFQPMLNQPMLNQPMLNQPVLNNQMPGVSDLTQFLLKKDLLLTRFTNFNDRPETYASWKGSFKSIIGTLNLSAFEEIDLLVKWLGPESRSYASSIRAANMLNPDRGLSRIWERLEDRYGRPEMVESALKSKIDNFPKLTVKDNKQLYQLSDLLSEIESCKENPKYATLLSYFDSSAGVRPIVGKLPHPLQAKWTAQASKYKNKHNVSFPPFTFFVNFIKEMASIRNDPSFIIDNVSVNAATSEKRDRKLPFSSSRPVLSRATAVASSTPNDSSKRCPIHKADHSLNVCRNFKSKSIADRKQFLKDRRMCFRCCSSTNHIARDCKVDIKCTDCGSVGHSSGMHIDTSTSAVNTDGGEKASKIRLDHSVNNPVSSMCTTLCGNGFMGRSCGKVVPVEVFPVGQPENARKVYTILDDQSNRSLACKDLIDSLGVTTEPTEYTLSSCSGTVTVSGRRVNNVSVRTVSGSSTVNLPILIECNEIPNDISEIPTPEVAKSYQHLSCLSDSIPSLDHSLNIELLIGRDVPDVHHVYEQIIGPRGTPFAQRLSLGWVIVGQVCLSGAHPPDIIYSNKTNIRHDGRGTVLDPCKNLLNVKEHNSVNKRDIGFKQYEFTGENIFRKLPEDDVFGLSIEDREFLKLMNENFSKDQEGHWTAPLPFKTPRVAMPNNRPLAWKRALILDSNLQKNPAKREHFVTFMHKVLESGAAEVAPPHDGSSSWYLPLFGVYHPKKPEQIRGVFDSSAVYQGVSLNSVLMSGPDLANSLLGVLLRFRMNKVAVTADIEQMFYQFYVTERHRDYLRFFWYKDNNTANQLIEYRMRVHVFGNSPSPAVATYGLRKAVNVCESEFGSDVKEFVTNNFYVDDGLISLNDSKSAIDLMKRTQAALRQEGNIRLHKITSNSTEVMEAFPVEDLSKDLKCLRINEDSLPIQHSLGLSWDLNSDQFLFDVQVQDKPYTKRGLLSTVNGLFDPMGFIAPITLSGKILLREITKPGVDWDEPLSLQHRVEWDKWRTSLLSLKDVKIPRMYTPESLSTSDKYELYIFSDASEKAIASCAYLKVWDIDNNSRVGFVMGKSRLAPVKGHTIPRLELCGAVLATEIGKTISDHLQLDPRLIRYFSDSKVVLGYISNQTRRFYTYVSNRVENILRISSSDQWSFVPTDKNPADFGTRSLSVIDIQDSPWLKGPKWLRKDSLFEKERCFPLVDPNEDKEVRPVTVLKTSVEPSKVFESYFKRCFSWRRLVASMSFLKHIARTFKSQNGICVGWHHCLEFKNVDCYRDSERLIIKTIQGESFVHEISCLSEGKRIRKDSSILTLSPFLDSCGILRVGGRLNKLKGQLVAGEINPVILPKNHHVSMLLIRHYHESVKHQGRYLTEGALRSAGYWLIGAKRAISSLIHDCVTCRKLRRDVEHQKMADLPIDRLTPGPPFTSVGVDTFGPWRVVTRKTRGGSAESKRWAILFTCLTTRAVHIELVQEMSSSSFINALRRFMSLRGPVKLLRSDRGSNFIGAVDDMRIDAINVEDGPVRTFLYESGMIWKFNVPHSSHMGGVWERMIGIARRILDSILLETKCKSLTHETLSTFILEVCAIMNSRPIANISTDPEMPMVLTPSMLLTGKVECLPVISDSLNIKDVYRAQWKHAQVLSDIFWKHWKRDYFQCLQSRRKWHSENCNVKIGDVVLMRDNSVHRNHWPLGLVTEAFESDDNIVRKVSVRVFKDGKCMTYMRPINELVLLIE